MYDAVEEGSEVNVSTGGVTERNPPGPGYCCVVIDVEERDLFWRC